MIFGIASIFVGIIFLSFFHSIQKALHLLLLMLLWTIQRSEQFLQCNLNQVVKLKIIRLFISIYSFKFETETRKLIGWPSYLIMKFHALSTTLGLASLSSQVWTQSGIIFYKILLPGKLANYIWQCNISVTTGRILPKF